MDLALVGLIVAVAAIVFAVIIPNVHRAVGSEDGRDTIIRWLESGRWWQRYHDKLRDALDWLDRMIDPPPFAPKAGTSRRSVGIKSLGVCIALPMIYSVAALLIGWVGGGPTALGDFVLLGEMTWAQAWLPNWLDWLPRLLVALLLGCLAASFYCFGRAVWRWNRRVLAWLTVRFDRQDRPLTSIFVAAVVSFAGIAVAAVVGGAVASVVAGAGGVAVGIAGVLVVVIAMTEDPGKTVTAGTRVAENVSVILAVMVLVAVAFAITGIGSVVVILSPLLFFLVLPCCNGILDWISLSVSRWFGRGILAESRSVRGLAGTVLLALADLVAALAFLFLIAWVLAFGVEALGLFFGQSFELDDYVRAAVADPWSRGLWASIMVLSTLLPTAIHFVLALAAVWFAWFGNPVGRWCAAQLRDGTAAHYLGPELYLVFGWTVPVLVVPLAMGWGLSHLFALVEPLPDAILATALDGISTARAWFG